jgi:host factor-I protein
LSPRTQAKNNRREAERGERIMAEKVNNLQDMFLNNLRRGKIPVTMFLVKGVKLQGVITWFDNFSVLLRRDGRPAHLQHAISRSCRRSRWTFPRSRPSLPSSWSGRSRALLQEVFLAAVRKSGGPVTMFLVNGVMLQGEIAAFDLFCMLLQRDGMSQLVYKHAISTVQPEHPVNLNEQAEDPS